MHSTIRTSLISSMAMHGVKPQTIETIFPNKNVRIHVQVMFNRIITNKSFSRCWLVVELAWLVQIFCEPKKKHYQKRVKLKQKLLLFLPYLGARLLKSIGTGEIWIFVCVCAENGGGYWVAPHNHRSHLSVKQQPQSAKWWPIWVDRL